jgi:hypothetical protein
MDAKKIIVPSKNVALEKNTMEEDTINPTRM